jgi:hypothetical protein
MRTSSKLLAAGLIALSAPLFVGAGVAAPLTGPRALSAASQTTLPVETVQWRRGWRGGWHRGWRGRGWIGPAAGVAAGLAIGSALAAPQYYGPGYGGAYVAGPPGPAGDPEVAYCSQRFRSYDPASGTYLGYDGYRHPCP